MRRLEEPRYLRRMRSLSALLLALVLSVSAFACGGGASYVVRGDTSFAGVGFRDTLSTAQQELGTTKLVVRHGPSCFATWRSVGVRIEFFAFAPDNPCTQGTVLSATMTGMDWQTAAGLHIGDAVAVLKSRHPGATLHGDGWWLKTQKVCELGGYEPYGSLVARVHAGKVSSFLFQGATCE